MTEEKRARRGRRGTGSNIREAVKSVKDSAETPYKLSVPVDWKKVLSTGSTLLDLAISGTRVRGGGVPAGILMEVYGRSGSGKTSILSELAGAAQANNGEVAYLDPEARLDQEYARIYGVQLSKENYHQPDTVMEMFRILKGWKPKGNNVNVLAADSLAALSTDMEMDKGDTMGMRKAKEFSQELRKHCRLIEQNKWLIACSNQIRQGQYGQTTGGGNAIEFYSSLRVSINQVDKIERTKKINDVEVKRYIGIESKCMVTKSTVDKPFREAPIYILFDYGIDDVRANLQWYKAMTKDTMYDCIDKQYQQMDFAVKFIENNDLELKLKERVIDLWLEIEEKFRQQRKPKRR